MASRGPLVIKPEYVALCLENLRRVRIHRTFAGYLCVRRAAAKDGRLNDLEVDFKEFFDTFFRVPGGEEGKPYVYAFVEEEPSDHNRWYNPNVAGSYAPSSLRSTSPFRKVISVAGSGPTGDIRYSLKDDYWLLARQHLLFGEKVPALELSTFLYRNYALAQEPVSTSAWVSVFQHEFDYLDPAGSPTAEFDHLFVDAADHESFNGWFEPAVDLLD